MSKVVIMFIACCIADSNARQDLYNSVEMLHGIGVFHGDIMPQNVVKGQDGVYKLIDFSLSAMHKCPERHSVSTYERSLSDLANQISGV